MNLFVELCMNQNKTLLNMTEQLLPWLNGQINLRTAYVFTRNQLLNCLQDIVTNPNTFGVPPENVPTLARVHQDICRLR